MTVPQGSGDIVAKQNFKDLIHWPHLPYFPSETYGGYCKFFDPSLLSFSHCLDWMQSSEKEQNI